MACILLWSSAVMVNDSQAYMNMDVTRERISRISELREIGLVLSFQTGFNLVKCNAAVVCVILDSISGLEPSSVITEPRYLKLVTLKLLSIHFDLRLISVQYCQSSSSINRHLTCTSFWRFMLLFRSDIAFESDSIAFNIKKKQSIVCK